MIFRKKPISDELAFWIIENFKWVIKSEGQAAWKEKELILPTSAYFTAPRGESHETALAVMHDIQRHLDLESMQITLEPLPSLPDEISHQYGQLSETAGQYWDDENRPLITYNPKLLRNSAQFINTMTHELMHGRMRSVVNALPGGSDAHELATDLHCIIHGFGLFQLNAAEDAGWTGYMSQPSRAFALSVFLQLTRTKDEIALGYLSGRPKKLMKAAFQHRQILQDEIKALTTDPI